MNVVISLEQRFDQTPDGTVWTQGPFNHSFWSRYLDVFENVHILARVRTVPIAGNAKPVTGKNVVFFPLPYYVGPIQYLRHHFQMGHIIEGAVQPVDAVIMRIPSQIGTILEEKLLQRKHPYSVEVVGDPFDVFAPGAVRHPLRPFFRQLFSRRQRKQCANAIAVAYVTSEILQQRYPAKAGAFTTHYSNVELPDEAFVPTSHQAKMNNHIITISSLEQLYKGVDTLLQAVAICLQSGLTIRLTIVGDGKYRSHLENLAQKLNLSEVVHFLGQLPSGAPVREELDRADLFVLPSRTEGLPRAMIEAMARGLPCIGSTVGGIPELLAAEEMVQPNDAQALADKIQQVVTNPTRMSEMSAHNLKKASEYHESLLRKRRNEFYQYVKDKTLEWRCR